MNGQQRRDAVLSGFEERRAQVLIAGRRALLRKLLDDGYATADDVYGAVDLAGIEPRCLGGVPRALVKAGIIRTSGYVPSARPERNASPLKLWELVDSRLAERWLAEHPEPVVVTKKTRQLGLPGIA